MTADGTALPEAFTRTIVSLLGDDAGAAWLRALPQTIVALASHWDLRSGRRWICPTTTSRSLAEPTGPRRC